MLSLSDFLEQNLDAVTGRWAKKVAERLGLEESKHPQLINDMPEVLTDLVHSLRTSPENWRSTSGRAHARQRVGLGVDIGGLSEEFGMIGETILELAAEASLAPAPAETSLMMRFLARCTSESVTEFARLTDEEIRRQSAEHFSFVAHELRTPLQSAQLAFTLLSTPPSQGSVLDRLQNSLRRLADLIDNSLVDARLTAEPNLEKDVTSSREVIDDVLNHTRDLAQQRNIDLRVDAEDFDFDADRRVLVSALTNLVVNGIKFSHQGGEVLIEASVIQERVQFEVSDSCGGLPEGAVAKMFQQFTQVGKDRSGFGLGLLIVKQAVQAHGGGVRVFDRPGEGCRMVVQLPRRRSRLSQAGPIPES